MSSVYRDVTITRDTRNALEHLAYHLQRMGWRVNAGLILGLIRKWDANDATEVRDEEDAVA